MHTPNNVVINQMTRLSKAIMVSLAIVSLSTLPTQLMAKGKTVKHSEVRQTKHISKSKPTVTSQKKTTKSQLTKKEDNKSNKVAEKTNKKSKILTKSDKKSEKLNQASASRDASHTLTKTARNKADAGNVAKLDAKKSTKLERTRGKANKQLTFATPAKRDTGSRTAKRVALTPERAKPQKQLTSFHVPNAPIERKSDSTGRVLQVGTASYYGSSFHGGRTASGERFDQNKLTCAHGSLPFGCKIRVTNLRNQRSVDVKVNDRGGFHKYGRVVDLSKAAANQIGMVGTGTARVKIEVLK